ncbi:hypothetical protein EBR57_01380 [bacterium]|nr:hypothetical protein [bacterium]
MKSNFQCYGRPILFIGLLIWFVTGSIDAGSRSDLLQKIQSQYRSISPATGAKNSPELPNSGGEIYKKNGGANTVSYDFILDKTVGGYGSLADRFNCPSGIACDARYIYVADKRNNRIVKLGHQFGSWDSIRITNESGIQLNYPDNVTLVGSNIVVSDSMNHRLVQFRDTGEYVGQVGELGILPGNFDTPRGVAQNSRRETLVCDSMNNRIQAFDDRGVFLYDWGQIGPEPETLVSPVDLVILKDDSVAVTDAATHCVKLFSQNGIWLETLFGQTPSGNAITLESPAGIAVDDLGTLFVADTAGNQVVAVSLTGRMVGVISTPSPMDVACWGDWVFVTNVDRHTVSKYRRTIL